MTTRLDEMTQDEKFERRMRERITLIGKLTETSSRKDANAREALRDTFEVEYDTSKGHGWYKDVWFPFADEFDKMDRALTRAAHGANAVYIHYNHGTQTVPYKKMMDHVGLHIAVKEMREFYYKTQREMADLELATLEFENTTEPIEHAIPKQPLIERLAWAA